MNANIDYVLTDMRPFLVFSSPFTKAVAVSHIQSYRWTYRPNLILSVGVERERRRCDSEIHRDNMHAC